MSQQQLPGQQQKSVQGQIHAVPCPWCGKANDFRTIESEQLLDTGGEHFCDYCGFSMEIVAIREVKVVAVRKNPKGGRAQAHANAARRQQGRAQLQKPGFIQRLLGKGK